MRSEHSINAVWSGGYDEEKLQAWFEGLRQKLEPEKPSLGLIFMTPDLFEHAEAILEISQVHGHIPLLAGCSSTGLIAGDNELEDASGLAVVLLALPGAKLEGHTFSQDDLEAISAPEDWRARVGAIADEANGWLVFADPFRLDCDSWLKSWNQAFPGVAVVGGLASGPHPQPETQVYLNGKVYNGGMGVAVAVAGNVELASVISQGCTPIGQTWTITKAEQNLIYEIASRPAYEVLLETVTALKQEDQKRLQGNLFIGLVTNEYLEDFHRGDFLIRNVIGADPKSGVLAVGALPRIGQTIQFQRRDAAAATEDMTALLSSAQEKFRDRTVYGGCLCCCNGRGHRLFGAPNHDAALVQNRLGPFGLAGFFCNGEIGPIGEKSFIHGYTASLALFLKKSSQ